MNEEHYAPETSEQHEAMQPLPSPGAVLREMRERRGESLADVAFALKLSHGQVAALEEERLDALPSLTFVKGFYRNYARHLGVDIEELLAVRWSEPQADHVNLAPVRNAVGALPNGNARVRFGRYAGWLVGALVIVFLLAWYFDGFRLEDRQAPEMGALQEEGLAAQGEESAVERSAAAPLPEADTQMPLASVQAFSDVEASGLAEPVTEEDLSALESESGFEMVESGEGEPPAEEEGARAETAAETESAEEIAAQENAGHRAVFQFDGEAWLEVRDGDGRTVYAGLNPADTIRSLQAEPPLSLTIGNAAQVKVEFNGQAIDLASHTGASGVARLTLE
ncbi:MAG TPA: RodZ domain-containing protein [Azoarcus sp.]|nr:RodZ domain-containing protein [Azoarcus sp.]